MESQRTGSAGANALKRELESRVARDSTASPDDVYDLLADLQSHLVWGGEQQSKKTRIVSIEGPEGSAGVGTEFTTVGADPMGEFRDRSVVTEATRPGAFEFVTEARLTTKKGATADWTNVHRYEIAATPDGCRISYMVRIVRISALPGMLAGFNVPGISGLLMKAAAGVGRRGVRNLASMAEARS